MRKWGRTGRSPGQGVGDGCMQCWREGKKRHGCKEMLKHSLYYSQLSGENNLKVTILIDF